MNYAKKWLNLPKESGIYQIRNKVNGKLYIGSSKNIRDRYLHHLSLLRYGNHHSIVLQRAWNKYKEENFDWSVLMLCPEKDLLIREQEMFDSLKPQYNRTHIASCAVKTHTKKTRIKMSKNRIKSITPEVRKTMSDRMKVLWKDKEYRENLMSSLTRGRIKLSLNDINEIRRLYESGEITNKSKLGRMFGVYHTTIIKIVTYTSWKRLNELV